MLFRSDTIANSPSFMLQGSPSADEGGGDHGGGGNNGAALLGSSGSADESSQQSLAGLLSAIFHVYDTQRSEHISDREFPSLQTNFPSITSFAAVDIDK